METPEDVENIMKYLDESLNNENNKSIFEYLFFLILSKSDFLRILFLIKKSMLIRFGSPANADEVEYGDRVESTGPRGRTCHRD